MATQPPIKTTPQDLDALLGFLKGQVGWSDIEEVKKRIPPKHADGRKIEAMRYLGLLERDGSNIKPTDAGRAYASADQDGKPGILQEQLRTVPLYLATLEWIHYHHRAVASKTDIANYWHDHHSAELGDASGDALTDAAVFFARIAGAAGFGQFVAAGSGRDTELRVDLERLAVYVEGTEAKVEAVDPVSPAGEGKQPPVKQPPTPPAGVTGLSLAGGLNVNVEIHIAADAKAATIEEIFKNMRKYLIDQPDTANGG